MLRNYLKIAFRNLWRQKVFTFINVIGLAVGMACAILIFLWVHNELSFESFQKNRNEIYAVSMRDSTDPGTREYTSFTVGYALAPLLKQQFPEILDYTRVQKRSDYESCMLKYDNHVFYDDGMILVDPSFFHMFTYNVIEGNPGKALPNKNSVVITKKIARKFFGNEDPLGKTLRFNNRIDLIVSAVIENPPHNSELQFDVAAPIQILGKKKLNSWAWESSSYIMVRKNTNIPELKKKIAGMIQKHDPMPGTKIITGIHPLTRIHLYYGSGDIRLVYIFVSVAIFILLIASINYMNLSTARFTKRTREVGLRKVLGANRETLAWQFILESVLLSVVALIVAIVFVEILLPFFNTITNKSLSFLSHGNPALIFGLLGLAIIVGVVAGSYPAFFLSSFQPASAISGTNKTNLRKSALRTVLVVSQFAIAIILVISTIVVYKQYNYLVHKDLGFKTNQIVYMRANKEIKKKYQSFKHELLKRADIKNVTIASSMPNQIGNTNPIKWEGEQDNKEVFINFAVVDKDYLKTFGMKLATGRDFSENIPTDISNFVINKKAAQLMDLSDPVGENVSFMGLKGKIIGVIDDFNNRPLEQNVSPLILTDNPSFYDYFANYVLVKINTSDIQGTVNYMKKISREFAPDYPFGFKFLDQTVNKLYLPVRRAWYLFEAFAFLAIFITCLGLFGLSHYLTELRTKEIGIRKVVGASVTGIVTMISKDYLKMVGIGYLVAIPVSWYAMHRWLEDFAYHIDIGTGVFVMGGILAMLIALATVSWQSIRAAIVNPVESLRNE